jgi:glycosyltransferase involved in cell wall biosynthesis
VPARAEPAGSGTEHHDPRFPSVAGSKAQRRIRVLIVIKGLGHGGAERLLLDTVTSADTAAFDYEIAYVLSSADALAPAIRTHGIPVHALGATGNVDLRWMRRLRELLARGQFDIAHFHLPYTAALGRLVVLSLPARTRPLTLYTEHSLWDKVSPPVKALNRLSIRTDRSLIAVSEAAYEALPSRLRHRARIVVHGIDRSESQRAMVQRDEIRARLRRELDVPERSLLVVTVAGLRAEKGYDVLLDAAHLVVRRGLPLHFAAAGEGALHDEVRARHGALGLDDRFRFLGHRSDALELIAGADMFVLASRQEGLPVVLMEATSVGTPIVATAVGGVPQVIEDGRNGIVVPPGDPEALAGALERLATDPDLRAELGHRALVRGAAFDVARSTAEIEALYARLVAGHR